MIRRLRRRAREFLFPVTSGLKPVRLDDLLAGGTELRPVFTDWEKDRGAGSLFDLFTVAAVAAHRRPKLCVEIGTGQGRTTLHLALNTPADARVVTVDLLSYPQSGAVFHGHPAAAKIQALTGDSRTFDFSSFRGKAGLVFVDGDHSEEAVLRDTVTAFDLVTPGGCILWDDAHPGWPGVVAALRRLNRDGQIFRVVGTKLAYHERPVS